jgi:hypothetical protein
MPLGPGKYDDLATAARKAAEATGVIVIVIGGNQGHGFSVQTHDLGLAAKLPAILRYIADGMEEDMGR